MTIRASSTMAATGARRADSSSVSRAQKLKRWLLNDAAFVETATADARRVDRLRAFPFVLIHLGALSVFFVGVNGFALALAVLTYLVRMFAITGWYHRYFSHRAFRAGRVTQYLMAVLGCSSGQRGPLWWAAHHREHHATSDTPEDPHSPRHSGFLYSHTLWFLTPSSFALRKSRVQDWLRYPELVWLERLDWVPFIGLGALCWLAGDWYGAAHPDSGVTGWQTLVWGFFVSTVVLYHATYTINSLAHRFGSRRYRTRDDSRNNFWLALITLGEGWHNNHHHYPAAARQGFFWWEVDLCFLGLRLIRALGLVSHLKEVPPDRLHAALVAEPRS